MIVIFDNSVTFQLHKIPVKSNFWIYIFCYQSKALHDKSILKR